MAHRSLFASIAFAACAIAVAPAFANGGDFFEELTATWSAANADSGVPFFGVVKDKKGKLIGNVSVKATTPNGSSFVVQSDAKGHYRIPGFSKSVNAKGVEITCSKRGYKLMARDRRILRGKADAPIETNCIMVPEPGSAIS
jgi:hypothetical protein